MTNSPLSLKNILFSEDSVGDVLSSNKLMSMYDEPNFFYSNELETPLDNNVWMISTYWLSTPMLVPHWMAKGGTVWGQTLVHSCHIFTFYCDGPSPASWWTWFLRCLIVSGWSWSLGPWPLWTWSFLLVVSSIPLIIFWWHFRSLK